MPSTSKLDYFGIAATYSGIWVDLNDHVNYILSADGSLMNTARNWRRVTTTSPVMDGEYLIHATLGMVSEQMKWWVYGQDQVMLAENIATLEAIFDQYDYRIRLTFDDLVETWACQLADITIDRSHTNVHNAMAAVSVTVPRFPEIARDVVA